MKKIRKGELREASRGFQEEKARVLAALQATQPDKSRAGAVDEDARQWVQQLNSSRFLFTNSSCAGRLIATLSPAEPAGYAVPWLYVTHRLREVGEAGPLLRQVQAHEQWGQRGEVWLKLEPPILAVTACHMEAAVKLMNVARGAAGLKRCSIVSVKPDGSVVLALMDTRRVETLLAEDGRLLLGEEYVQRLLLSCQRKLEESRAKFDALCEACITMGERKPKKPTTTL